MRIIKWLFWLFLFLMISGTSFAIAEPESALASPFRGVATTTLEITANAISAVRDPRTVMATEEHAAVSISVRLLKDREELPGFTPVASTNDMSLFPSKEHPLFPDYIQIKTTMFSYDIDSSGEVELTTEGVRTDPSLTSIFEKIERLRNAEAQGGR